MGLTGKLVGPFTFRKGKKMKIIRYALLCVAALGAAAMLSFPASASIPADPGAFATPLAAPTTTVAIYDRQAVEAVTNCQFRSEQRIATKRPVQDLGDLPIGVGTKASVSFLEIRRRC